MTLGGPIALIVIGAILHYAITAEIPVIDLQALGAILMVLGVIALVFSLLFTFVWRPLRRGRVERETASEREPRGRL